MFIMGNLVLPGNINIKIAFCPKLHLYKRNEKHVFMFSTLLKRRKVNGLMSLENKFSKFTFN